MRQFLGLALVILFGCRGGREPRDAQGRRVVRIGYLLQVGHAPILGALDSGGLSAVLGEGAVAAGRSFASGPMVVEALFAGELDLAYLGPNPAINAYVRSQGRAVRVLSGCTYGGAQLVAGPQVETAADLIGKRVASPALGNTQDVALRRWLGQQRLLERVEVTPQSPADASTLFSRGELAGAWLPEPWASRWVLELGAHVLVDERELWPDGLFPSVVLVSSTAFLQSRPDLVRRFLAAHEQWLARMEEPSEQMAAADVLGRLTGRALRPDVVQRAFSSLVFSSAPPWQLSRLAADAQSVGLLDRADLRGLLVEGGLASAATVRLRGTP